MIYFLYDMSPSQMFLFIYLVTLLLRSMLSVQSPGITFAAGSPASSTQ